MTLYFTKNIIILQKEFASKCILKGKLKTLLTQNTVKLKTLSQVILILFPVGCQPVTHTDTNCKTNCHLFLNNLLKKKNLGLRVRASCEPASQKTAHQRKFYWSQNPPHMLSWGEEGSVCVFGQNDSDDNNDSGRVTQ